MPIPEMTDPLKWRSDDKRSYLQERFYPEDFKKEYKKNKLFLGYTHDGEEISIPTTKSLRMVVVGGTGDGKSFLMGGIASRLALAGHGVAVPTDIKPEYYFMKKPLQKKFHRFLAPGENPQGFDTVSYYPFFFTKFVSKPRGYDELCQLSFNQINVFDLLTILNMNLTDPQRIAIERTFTKAKDKGCESFVDFLEMLEKNPEVKDATQRSIKSAIRNAMELGIIGDTYADFSFTDAINNGSIPILNLYGWGKVGRYTHIPSAFLAVVIRDLSAAKAEGFIKPNKLWLFIEEALRFCPKDAPDSMTSKREILECVDITRQYGISMVFATQSVRRLPDEILGQSRYILMSYKVGQQTAQDVFKDCGFYDYPAVFGTWVANRIRPMKEYRDGSRDWMLLDKRKKTYTIFKPAAPLFWHKCEK